MLPKIKLKKTRSKITVKKKESFPIIGIGASAGGLAAFEAFFSGISQKSKVNMSFVLVQHLSPDYKSLLVEIVSRYTRLKVIEVKNGTLVKKDCVYIIPSNHDMALRSGVLYLLKASDLKGPRTSIDFFFRSLAEDLHEKAIGIILSGTGSDGTLGIKAIKGEGGMVIIQKPESCEYDEMPKSALSTGLVDFTLPAAEMFFQIISYNSHPNIIRSKIKPATDLEDNEALKKILTLLYTHTGHDFSHYKKNSILRRIERRLAIHHITKLSLYALLLQHDSSEVDKLFQDLLIGVTCFFRDNKSYEVLEQKALITIIEKNPKIIRVWVAACSTGEEAYSIAILLHEKIDALKKNIQVQIFATDIDKRAISKARTGIFHSSIISDISEERLTRYFTKLQDANSYQINKVIRDSIIFSEQDILKDPPFSKLDLISCRNFLIYIDIELQRRIIPLFHYSLVSNGFLFLGSSETIGEYEKSFSTIDRRAKLYQRKDGPQKNTLNKLESFLSPFSAKGFEKEVTLSTTEKRKKALNKKDQKIKLLKKEKQKSGEELKSSNEEMQAMNEELQSSNEELQTSKEELQSINEELSTINTELQYKVQELSRANNDMNNLLAGTGVATVFIDLELRITRFTPAASKIINLILSDVGRPLGDIVHNIIGHQSLIPYIETVLRTLQTKECEIQTRIGDWYMLRILPYRTQENIVEGAVIIFLDITKMKQAVKTEKE